jgi:general secretion pathway protein M
MTAIRRIYEQFYELNEKRRLQLLVGCAVFIALVLLYTMSLERVKRLELRRATRETEIKEMLLMKQRYRDAFAAAGATSNLLAAVRSGETVAGLIDETGIKGGGVQIKPLKPEEKQGVAEESAEVRIDRLTLNEVVNLLYRLEQGGRPVSVKRVLLKARFDDPSRVDLSLVVALQKPAGQR